MPPHWAALEGQNRALFDKAMIVFRKFDHNKDGLIDRAELRRVLLTLDPIKWSDDKVDALFNVVDANHDRMIQFEELLRWSFAGRGDQPAFREHFDMQNQVQETVHLEVLGEEAETIFEDEHLIGSLTVGHLRRRIASETGLGVGCLYHEDSGILRDRMEIGVYASKDEPLTVRISNNVFELLPAHCRQELEALGALGDFRGEECIRLGCGKRLKVVNDEGAGRGDDDSEFVLRPDGRALAKRYRYWGQCGHKGNRRTWTYEIAEGSFSVLDVDTCFIEIHWRRWGRRVAEDSNTGDMPSDELLSAWECMEFGDEDEPHHLVPSSNVANGGKVNVLFEARKALEGWRESHHRIVDPRDDPLAGLPMPGVTSAVLIELEMRTEDLDYWSNGSKAAGPFGT
eukprot:TRINITY_DN9369_c0_g1_i1.p1 TRINITY_DN9369_c0_g1~~TRINITY_DN9369_c0_g1_i1.p1  ORF type:complete len:399 (-),score=90.43 TRINITY_DN9369_c0_g1_i1:137-1333(-)